MRIVDLTWLSWFTFAFVCYYGLLYVTPSVRKWRSGGSGAPASSAEPFMVLVVPAHNEEAVIEQTLRTLSALDYEDRLVLVMNDGSSDDTSALARNFSSDGRVEVIDRDPSVAGQGKGAVLNHAFAVVSGLVASGDARLGGRSADSVVIGVLDADGQLQRGALREVAPYFADPDVGGVQIGVRIANATDNWLTRMQDLEFVGFSAFVQEARDGFGSVGLGGNGQFTRLSALQALGRDPWTKCLTEDLDLSLSLATEGWRIRYCPSAFVAQQGLRKLRPLLRQRARWTQGHYQCWRHLPSLWRSPLRRVTKIDLTLYLVLITFVMLVFAGACVSVASWSGFFIVENNFLEQLPEGPARNLVLELLSFGPPLAFLATYQRRARNRLRWWEMPTYMVGFSVYAYLTVLSQFWAWGRMVLRRDGWAKTPRVTAEAAV